MDFEKIVRDVSAMGLNLYDLAVYQGGKIQSHCFCPCNRCNDSYSVAKAFTMTAVGLMWEEKKLSLTDRVCDLFPNSLPENMDPAWRQVTLEHALTHRMGLGQGILDIDVEDTTRYPTQDFLRYLFSAPLPYPPGTQRVYSDGAYYLLSRVVSLVAGERMDDLLARRILQPMCFREAAWSRDPQQYPIGATGLYISTEDMVKLGALYLQDGVYDGQRLLSSDWVRLALQHEFELRPVTTNGLIGKGGMYGQGLYFSPQHGFAIAWHAHQRDGRAKALIAYADTLS